MRTSLLLLLAPAACGFRLLPSAVRQSTSGIRRTTSLQLAPPHYTMMAEATDAPAPAVAAPSAFIEFIIGVPEPCVPDVSITRSRDGSTGVATFTFDNPSFLMAATSELGETTGMYLKDSEGTLKTSEVTATFTNGKPRIVKGVVVLQGADEWDRFMRFMERYAESNGLGFSKA
mmetsp:Transcript_69941/g.138621  ORF Transcript_69941/g.138621 Transcript_69941/m.138621 type:complete len:174 (-) Transcript_69941:445-966(-)